MLTVNPCKGRLMDGVKKEKKVNSASRNLKLCSFMSSYYRYYS